MSDEAFNLEAFPLSSLGIHMIYDEINEVSSRAACEFLIKSNYLFDSKDNVTLYVNSPGGHVTEGWAIIDMMEASRVKVATRAIGEIASMGVSIFVAGTNGMRTMTPRTSVMTHQFSGFFYGKEHELMAVRKHHDTLSAQFIQHFKRHTKMTEKQIRDVLLRESDTYLDAKDCLKYGLCDRISDPWETEVEAKEKQKKAAAKKTVARKPAAKKTPVTKAAK